ncbi:MAG TPA: hypothetical protein DC031_18405 [Sulfitobacter sp.]|nr:hypothetical protein [Sulfitobacter sp.]HBB85181.1 hypothetical protein [Sulfitobacter sp.]
MFYFDKVAISIWLLPMIGSAGSNKLTSTHRRCLRHQKTESSSCPLSANAALAVECFRAERIILLG